MSEVENNPVPAEPVSKKKIAWKSWLPVAFFAFSAVILLVMYLSEHALRMESERALGELRSELGIAQAQVQESDQMRADAEKSFFAEREELTKKIEALEADKMALEKERDQYKEGSWNSQQELEKLKAEIVTLRTQAQKEEIVPTPEAPLALQEQPSLEEAPLPQA